MSLSVCVCVCVLTCQIHKYCIQAVVLRHSWPLSQSQWSFVQAQKENGQNEQNEVKGLLLTVSYACEDYSLFRTLFTCQMSAIASIYLCLCPVVCYMF